jgi:hypothetical protein
LADFPDLPQPAMYSSGLQAIPADPLKCHLAYLSHTALFNGAAQVTSLGSTFHCISSSKLPDLVDLGVDFCDLLKENVFERFLI